MSPIHTFSRDPDFQADIRYGGPTGKERAKGVWVPEDRLCAVWIGQLVLVPISVTLVGLVTTYVDGTIGLVINFVCLFTNGVGVNMALTPMVISSK
ncbi:hypothetical protein L210DRAFT_986102 [Boletus edulis BED1]|uniref:Uncharacterized protein n=1 Tax=Boletus edulis BED1 TaxID=1328754 RepID=A0AAD4G712_BOLED|nr:hypothetical protein L210DRAFT_986102 [Boletus edulis BED1]